MVEFNLTTGKRDTGVALATGAKEENFMYRYYEDHHGYDNFHLEFDYCEDEISFQSRLML